MLFGIVFLSHQVGAFLGVWLAGRLFDATGSYAGIPDYRDPFAHALQRAGFSGIA